MGIFSGLFAGFALIAAIRQGVIGRLRVTPLSRVGLLLGRELVFVALIGFQAVVIAVVALIFGLRVPLLNLLLALVLLALMVLIGVSISYVLAIFVPNQTALINLTNGVTEPLALLAGVLIPLSVAPLWVRDVALWNPFAWGANGMRAIFQGHIGAHGRLGGDRHPGRAGRGGRGGVVTGCSTASDRMKAAMKLARDTWLTFQYEAGQLVRSPVAIAATLLNPVTYLLFFTPFLKSVLHAPTYGDAYRIYVPLLFCTMGLFGGLFAGFALLAAIRQGVIARFRVTPLSRVGLLLGRELMFVAMIGFQAVVITVIALILRAAGAAGQFPACLDRAGDDGAAWRLDLVRHGARRAQRERAGQPDQRGGPAALAAGRGPDPAVGRTAVGAATSPCGTRGPGRPTACGPSSRATSAPRSSGRRSSSWPGWPRWPWCCRPGCSPARSHDRASRSAIEPGPARYGPLPGHHRRSSLIWDHSDITAATATGCGMTPA